jgi:hypothetical protein
MPNRGLFPVADTAIEKFRQTFDAQVAAGFEKYGTRLQTFNGRNAANDAREEVADLLQYMTQVELERDTLALVLKRMRTYVDEDDWAWVVPDEIAQFLNNYGEE